MASEREREVWSTALDYLDSWLSHRHRMLHLPGMQVAVYFDGGIRFSRSYGFANLDTAEPLENDHRFRIASHSKTFTGTAVLRLVERGVLRLDDRVDAYVPALATSPLGGRSIRELLEQSAGITRDSADAAFWQLERAFPDEAELLRILVDEGEIYPANERFKYSNIGYSLLGLVIAGATGTSYNEHVRREIVDVLGLTNTGPEADGTGRYAEGHSGRHLADTRHALPPVDTRAMSAATGFYSTAEDLVRFASAHFFGDERLLSDASKRQQQHPAWSGDPTDPDESSYGLGMSVRSIGARPVVGHSGGFPGHKTQTLIDPHAGLAVSVLVNAIDGPAAELGIDVLRLLDHGLGTSSATGSPAGPDFDFARYTGRFVNMWRYVDVVRLGDRLVAIDPGFANPNDGALDLEPIDETSFRIVTSSGFASVGETLRYRFAADGTAESITGIIGMTYRAVNSQP